MINLPAFPPELLAGCKNAILDYAKVAPGSQVLILSEMGTYVDPFVVHALATVVQESGSEPTILWTKHLEKGWWQELSPVVRGAIANSDVIIQNNLTIGKTHMLDIMLETKVRRLRNYATDMAIMTSDWAQFPVEIQDTLEIKVNTILHQAETFRVVSEEGTDISGEVSRRTAPWRKDMKRSGGKNISFPPSVFRAKESLNANGVIMVYATYPWGARRVGLPETRFTQPVKLVVENNQVVNIEGGWEADRYRKLFEDQAAIIGERAYYIDSFHSGASPRAFVPFDPRQDTYRYDKLAHSHECWFHFHIGNLSGKGSDEDGHVEVTKTQKVEHINAVCMNPTVYMNGEKIWNNGRLTLWNDPELRAVASKYGDPEVLFSAKQVW